jgi:hypothetical protein
MTSIRGVVDHNFNRSDVNIDNMRKVMVGEKDTREVLNKILTSKKLSKKIDVLSGRYVFPFAFVERNPFQLSE